MKRCLTILLVAMMGLSLVACGNGSASNEGNDEVSISGTSYNKNDLGSILSAMTTEGDNAIQNISDESASVLNKLGETYDTYDANKTSVTDFYRNSLEKSNDLYATFEAMSIDYFKCVSAQGLDDYDAWDGAMEDFYDTWDEIMDDYYNALDEAYEDIYDQCDNLIESASGTLDYSEYSDAWSEMYGSYSDAWSNMYDTYLDAWSKTYDTYLDVWSGFYNEETDVDAILNAAAEEDAQADNSDENASDNTNETNPSSEDNTSDDSNNQSDGTESEYELAFEKNFSSYSLYLMVDTDEKTVVQFGTDDTYLYRGNYSGDLSSGVTINWNHGQFTEQFTYEDGGTSGSLIDPTGTVVDYSICDIESAQSILDTRE